MSETTVQLKRIQDKLQQLVRNHQSQRKENERLKEELEQSRKQVSEYQEKIDSLKQQVAVLKLNSGEMSDGDKKEFEKKLSRYIREIDRCIAMLDGA